MAKRQRRKRYPVTLPLTERPLDREALRILAKLLRQLADEILRQLE